MPGDELQRPAADAAVRAALASADRRRRAREASRRIWRTAPYIAATGLVVAILRRWTLWAAWTPAAVLIVGAGGLAAYVYFSRRRQAVSDETAAAIDAAANLGGELRSASWFAARETRDDWAELHLARAAERLRGIDWRQLYPAIRAPRARIATAAMAIGALALTLVLPERVGVHPSASASTVAAPDATGDQRAAGELLPPELLRQLEALLAAAKSGDMAAVDRLANSAELRELLKKLAADPELFAKLARALAANQDPLKGPTAKDLKALAESARRAAEFAEMSQELRDALERMADEADLAESEESAGNDGGDADSSDGPKHGETGQANASSGMQELSVQISRQTDAGGGAGIMMMSKPDEQGGGPPGSGVGGAGAQEAAAAAAAALAAAFRQEVVEASQDNAGANVDAEIRRKTEQGNSSVAFTNSAAGTFDKSRVAPPPAVPEARRTGVQTYFIRKSQ